MVKPYFQVKAITLVDGFVFEGEEEETNMFGVRQSMEESS
jgi:hypothetical protein